MLRDGIAVWAVSVEPILVVVPTANRGVLFGEDETAFSAL